MNARSVPVLDIGRLEHDRERFVAELGGAYREYGFCCLRGHGIPDALIDAAYAAFRALFELPEAIKLRYRVAGGGGARGYTPYKTETARNAQHADLKEFWHIGRELPPGSPHGERLPPNLWPHEVPAVRCAGHALYQALDELGRRVLKALALHLGLAADWFESRVDHGNSILRALHYPPISETALPNVRAGAHEDIDLITLLVGASDAGLEILTRQGDWLAVAPPADAIVVNIGDMLQRLSNHVFPSTTHRVVNPTGEASRRSRYSVPFFLHPNPELLIKTLPQCVDAGHPDRYPQPITADEYLMRRLREIRLL